MTAHWNGYNGYGSLKLDKDISAAGSDPNLRLTFAAASFNDEDNDANGEGLYITFDNWSTYWEVDDLSTTYCNPNTRPNENTDNTWVNYTIDISQSHRFDLKSKRL